MVMYDENYYEKGLETGVSNFSNYRWMPEATMAMAMTIIDHFGITKNQTLLDYGCAKGYLVKAFRLLRRKAWGIDISRYAISKVDPSVRLFCCDPVQMELYGFPTIFDICIAKDVFEHIEYDKINERLRNINSTLMFVIVPLGKNGKYNARANNLDKTHIICEHEVWWHTTFVESGWEVVDFTFKVDGIKDNYNHIEKAHGFYTLVKSE